MKGVLHSKKILPFASYRKYLYTDTCIWSKLRKVRAGYGGRWRSSRGFPCNINFVGKQVVTKKQKHPNSGGSQGYLSGVREGPPFKKNLYECTCSSKSGKVCQIR